MKKNYFFYAVLLMIPVASLLLVSNAAGKTGGFSGSPGDGGTTCMQCHSGGNFSADPTITTDIPSGGYSAGTTYEITVAHNSTSSKNGFQLTAENASGEHIGSFAAGTGNQVVNGGTHVTHLGAGTSQATWVFQWTAPSTGVTPVTFYAAVNSTNANNGTSGDQVTTTTATAGVLSVGDHKSIVFDVYPNPVKNTLKFNGLDDFNSVEVHIYTMDGRMVKNAQVDAHDSQVDISSLPQGVYLINLHADNRSGIKKFIKS
jgi:hypothetical protein